MKRKLFNKETFSISVEQLQPYDIETELSIDTLEDVYVDWCFSTQDENEYYASEVYLDFFKYLETDFDCKIIGKSKNNSNFSVFRWE